LLSLCNDGQVALTVNGEIYNHEELREQLIAKGHTFRTRSDCEPILHLYEEKGEDFVDELSGDFAFVVHDARTGEYLAARDPIGVVPLFIGRKKNAGGCEDTVMFASEYKALQDDCDSFEVFPPGHLYSSRTGGFRRYYNPLWFKEIIPTQPVDFTALRTALELAVVRRMMSDVPYGVLLSGGLDSSLVAAIASRHAEGRVEDGERSRAWWPRLHSFCIGIEGAPDLAAALEVAKFLKTVHHSFTFTVQEGTDALPDVIQHLETYDVTTIRASTPMYFLARKIKANGVKMVLSGEGSDEIFGGYLYFHRAPNAEEFHKETCRRVKHLHLFDCLRANKSTAAWGVEVRVPFLDRDFIDTSMNISPQDKLCGGGKIEKHILRAAFDTPDRPYLPANILWRQKEQFSDGVGYSWIGGLKAHAEREVSDEKFAQRSVLFPYDTPETKEAFLYRSLFESRFPSQTAANTVAHWVPTWSDSTDPSGRAQPQHLAAEKK